VAGSPTGPPWDGSANHSQADNDMKAILRVVDLLYGYFLKVLNAVQSLFLLAIRVYWGWLFLESGLGKISHIEKVVDYFTELGIPAPSFNAHFNAGLETVGGILLILGLGSRVIAVPLLINMIVAFITAEREAFMSFFSESGKFFAADAFPFLLASLLVLIFGPGFLSTDTLIATYRKTAWAAMGRAKLVLLLWVLFILVYGTVYAGFSGFPQGLVRHWWNALIAVALSGFAYAATQAIFKKGIGSRKGLIETD
jgi:putative oxidoreductase